MYACDHCGKPWGLRCAACDPRAAQREATTSDYGSLPAPLDTPGLRDWPNAIMAMRATPLYTLVSGCEVAAASRRLCLLANR